MKYNNRILSFVFIGLLLLVILTRWVKSSSSQQSFKASLVNIDTAQVSALVITPQVDPKQEVRLVRENNQWFLQKDGQEIEIDNGILTNTLGQLSRLPVLRMAARSKDKWKEYDLEDAQATQLKVLSANNTELLTILIGRAGSEGVDPFSYVRIQGEDEVYAVKASLSQDLNKKMNDWRDQTFIKFSPPDIRKLVFNYPQDSGFSLIKNEISWQIGDLEADSAQTVRILNYLQEISNLRMDSFEDKAKPSGKPAFELIIEGVNMKPIAIQAFVSPQKGEFILSSALNPKAFFRVNAASEFGRIFKGRTFFEE